MYNSSKITCPFDKLTDGRRVRWWYLKAAQYDIAQGRADVNWYLHSGNSNSKEKIIIVSVVKVQQKKT